MNKEMLRGLRERVEKCSRPDREIDANLWAELVEDRDIRQNPANLILAKSRRAPFDEYIVGWIDPGKHQRNFQMENGVDYIVPRYTASIDAALALVERCLPGCSYQIDVARNDEGADSIFAARIRAPYARYENSEAATLPLAILTALLSALEAQAE